MDSSAGSAAEDSAVTANPVLVEVRRGDMVESRHRAAFAVVDTDGHVVLSAGDVERQVYPRSAIKPIQALPLIETGAADAFDLTDVEIALACASHNGESCHVSAVRAWLDRIGLSERDLVCGADPGRGRSRRGPAHDNCSGKHTGFLTVARHLGYPSEGYHRRDHAVQQRVLGVLEQMTGLDLDDAPRGIDGCGIPVIGIPLGNIALAMARLADPHDQPEGRQAACARICAAMAAEPFMVAGSGRFCTRVMEAVGPRAVVKTGAEGVYCAALPEHGLGVAIKADDGAPRAAEAAMAGVLRRLGIIGEAEAYLLTQSVRNRVGLEVGQVRAAEAGPL
jgi:L-asparaginase II